MTGIPPGPPTVNSIAFAADRKGDFANFEIYVIDATMVVISVDLLKIALMTGISVVVSG